jgi:hypothetical protein
MAGPTETLWEKDRRARRDFKNQVNPANSLYVTRKDGARRPDGRCVSPVEGARQRRGKMRAGTIDAADAEMLPHGFGGFTARAVRGGYRFVEGVAFLCFSRCWQPWLLAPRLERAELSLNFKGPSHPISERGQPLGPPEGEEGWELDRYHDISHQLLPPPPPALPQTGIMSQDLLSEFDSFYQPPKPAAPPPPPPPPPSVRNPRGHTPSHSVDSRHRHVAQATTFDDLLGIMDTGLMSNPRPPPPPQSRPISYQERRMSRRALNDDPYASGLFDVAPQRGTATSDLFAFAPTTTHTKRHSHSQSLFDFDNFTPTPPPPRRQSKNLADLSTLITPALPPPAAASKNGAAAADDDDDFGDFVASPVATPDPQKAFRFPPPAAAQNGGARAPPPASRAPPPISRTRQARPQSFHSPLSQSTSNAQSISLTPLSIAPKLPPAPTPPPFPPVSLLLQTLTPLFLLPSTHLLDNLKGLPFPLRQRVLSHPRTKSFLEAICELGRVAGRIIAGRKRRARRATMVVGRSNLEQQKEEREVKEAVRIWKEGMGRLKAAMGQEVPEIIEDFRGVYRGSEVCRLCKLGRGEVVPGLKETVQRWSEGWGHRGCKAFWEKHGKDVGRGY